MFDKRLVNYLGSIDQWGGLRSYTLNTSSAKGVDAVDIDTGAGLYFTLLIDRGLDIYSLKYKGFPVAYISRTGITAPAFYESDADGWLRGFQGGFLTTCGLTQSGDACIYKGEKQGLHGRYSNIPGKLTVLKSEWQDGKYVMTVQALMRQCRQAGENLTLQRTVECTMGENSINIHDVITNEGSRPSPLMMIYHMNFGYPLINPKCGIFLPIKSTEGWDDFSSNNIDTVFDIDEPTDDARDYTFRHKLNIDEKGKNRFLICDNAINPEIAVMVTYDSGFLHTLGQWKYLCSKDYVMALEPCNNHIRGISYEEKEGTLDMIKPDESICINMTAQFFDDKDTIKAHCRSIEKLCSIKRRKKGENY